jgi:hypothetical protein
MADSSGAKTQKSASAPTAMRPLRDNPASAAGPDAVQATTSSRPCPRARACDQIAGNPSCSDEIPPQADRPYGLIEASIIRDDLPTAPEAWLGVKGFI